jgi:hypothetical protein
VGRTRYFGADLGAELFVLDSPDAYLAFRKGGFEYVSERVGFRFAGALPLAGAPSEAGVPAASLINFTNRGHASARAALFPGSASGASPWRMKACPAPLYTTGSNFFLCFFIAAIVLSSVAFMRASCSA